MTQLTITLTTTNTERSMAISLLRRLLARTCFRDVQITTTREPS